MKVAILYRPNSEHETRVNNFVRDYRMMKGYEGKFDLVDLNTREGMATASLYDITAYPAFLALSDDGQLQQVWQGENVPMLNEIDAYASGSSMRFVSRV